MSRGYASNKRQREDERARKKQDKARRRADKRDHGPREIPVENGPASGLGSDSPSLDQVMRSLERGGNEDRSAAAIPARLFVGSLAYDVTEDDLRDAFSQIGPVTDVMIVRDRDSGSPRGFGFVTLQNRKDAQRAISELNGVPIRGRNIVVNVATGR